MISTAAQFFVIIHKFIQLNILVYYNADLVTKHIVNKNTDDRYKLSRRLIWWDCSTGRPTWNHIGTPVPSENIKHSTSVQKCVVRPCMCTADEWAYQLYSVSW